MLDLWHRNIVLDAFVYELLHEYYYCVRRIVSEVLRMNLHVCEMWCVGHVVVDILNLTCCIQCTGKPWEAPGEVSKSLLDTTSILSLGVA